MALKLEIPSMAHKERYEDMMDEWEAYGGRLNPGALRRRSAANPAPAPYETWLHWSEEDRTSGRQELFFLVDEDSGRLLGAISIRAKVEPDRLYLDGHSGYGIRPSERRKGYASRMLALALPLMHQRGINPVIITCAKDNPASAKTAQSAGGVLVRETEDEGELMQAYEISLEIE